MYSEASIPNRRSSVLETRSQSLPVTSTCPSVICAANVLEGPPLVATAPRHHYERFNRGLPVRDR